MDGRCERLLGRQRQQTEEEEGAFHGLFRGDVLVNLQHHAAYEQKWRGRFVVLTSHV